MRNDTITFADAGAELSAIREVVVPIEGETVFACVKKKLRSAKRLEDTAEKLVKEIGKRWVGEDESPETHDIMLMLLDDAGLLDKDGVARVDHPLYYALPKALREKKGE